MWSLCVSIIGQKGCWRLYLLAIVNCQEKEFLLLRLSCLVLLSIAWYCLVLRGIAWCRLVSLSIAWYRNSSSFTNWSPAFSLLQIGIRAWTTYWWSNWWFSCTKSVWSVCIVNRCCLRLRLNTRWAQFRKFLTSVSPPLVGPTYPSPTFLSF